MYENSFPPNVRTLNSNMNTDKKFAKKIVLSTDILGFIRKVCGIVCCQLIFSALLCIYSMLNISFTIYLLETQAIFFAGIIGLILYFCLLCDKSLQRKYPTNYIFLAGITLCESIIPAVLCGLYDRILVAQAFFITAGIVAVLCYFAYTTDHDFTTDKQVQVILICIPIFCLISAFFMYSDIQILICCALGAAFYGIYLIVDIQLILGRIESERTLSYDDYIIASIEIYFDIIRLFVKILQILEKLKEDRRNSSS